MIRFTYLRKQTSAICNADCYEIYAKMGIIKLGQSGGSSRWQHGYDGFNNIDGFSILDGIFDLCGGRGDPSPTNNGMHISSIYDAYIPSLEPLIL